MRRTQRNVIACLIFGIWLLPSSLPAQFGPGLGGFGGDQPDRVTASLVVQQGELVAGKESLLGVVMEIQPGWKIQAGKGSGDEVAGYVDTTLEWDIPTDWQLGRVLWPPAKQFVFGDDNFSETLAVYEGKTLAAIRVTVPEATEPGEYRLRGAVGYQACDDATCEMPTEARFEATVRVVAPDQDPEAPVDGELAELFQKVLAREDQLPPPPETEPTSDPESPAAPDDGEGAMSDEELTGVEDSEPIDVESESGRPTFFGLSLPSADGLLGWMLLAVFSALGGFLLNLTPCVLPVIPLKVMAIQKHANKPGENLVLGLWMALGVTAFWVVVGLPVAFVAGVADPSRLFGIWWLTLAIGLLIGFMGVGIMGMFTIQLPNAVYAINPKADTAWGSFLFGVMTAVLGLPCFGFVAGALLAGAATMPAGVIMTIFTSLGVGMAAPYLILAARPGLVEKLPKSGPASELVKQVMGLMLLAAASYFAGAGLIALVNEMPFMSRQLHWWVVALFAALAGLWLIVRTFQITSHPKPRLTFLVIGLLLGGAAIAYATDSTRKAREDWLARQEAIAAAGGAGYATHVWNSWTPESFAQAREDGHVVVLDFTAEWCLNCKFLKATVLNRDPVRSLMMEDDIVMFTVDLTSTSAPGWDFLRDELGQTGIPLLAVYSPGQDVPWQSNAYTPQQVVAAVEKARR